MIIAKNISKKFNITISKNAGFLRRAFEIFQKKRIIMAVDDFSYEFKKGIITGIIGPNGSGKSTVLRILSGTYNPDNGEIITNGKILPLAGVGSGLIQNLDTQDNIYLMGYLIGMTKKEVKEKFESIIKFAELEDFINAKINQYSEGMKARLIFSIGIHSNFDILLLDEILAVGDKSFTDKCLKVITDFKEQGKVIVLVSHALPMIQEYCSECIYMEQGKIVSSGETKKVIEDYVNADK